MLLQVYDVLHQKYCFLGTVPQCMDYIYTHWNEGTFRMI